MFFNPCCEGTVFLDVGSVGCFVFSIPDVDSLSSRHAYLLALNDRFFFLPENEVLLYRLVLRAERAHPGQWHGFSCSHHQTFVYSIPENAKMSTFCSRVPGHYVFRRRDL